MKAVLIALVCVLVIAIGYYLFLGKGKTNEVLISIAGVSVKPGTGIDKLSPLSANSSSVTGICTRVSTTVNGFRKQALLIDGTQIPCTVEGAIMSYTPQQATAAVVTSGKG